MSTLVTRATPDSATALEQRLQRRWIWPAVWLSAVSCMAGLGVYHFVAYMPHLDQPHRFAVLDRAFDVGVAAAVLFCAMLLGLRCLAWLRLGSAFRTLELLALAAGLGLGTLSLLTLGLGFLHLYYGVAFAIILALMPWLFPQERRQLAALMARRLAPVRRAKNERQGGRPEPPQMMVIAPQLALMAVVVSVVFLTLRDDMTMPSASTGYDTYQYHWAVPLLLLRNHGWQAFPGWIHANLPFGTEMLNLLALSLQAPQAAMLIQDAFGLLTALLLFAIVQRHFGTTTAWLAVAAETTIPVLMMYSTQSYVETALIFYGLAALVSLVHVLEQASDGSLPDWRLLALAGIFLGSALSVKFTAVEYLPAAVVLSLLGLGISLRRRDCAPSRQTLMKALAALTVLVGGMVLVVAPWLVKDWVLLGNPVYPALSQVFATPVWDAARSQALALTLQHFGPKGGTVAQFHLYAFDLFVNPRSYGEGTAFPVGSVCYAAGLGIPYLAYQLWRARRFEWDGRQLRQMVTVFALGVTGVGALLVWTFSGALVERYALPGVVFITVLGATLIGWILSWVPRRLIALTWLIVGIVVVDCFVQEIPFVLYYHAERDPVPVLTDSVSEQAFQRAHAGIGLTLDFYRTVDYVNQRLPHDGKLLMIGRGSGYLFTNRDYVADSGGDWVPYLVREGKTPDGILRMLRAQGFTYVVYDAFYEYWLTHIYGNSLIAADLPTYLAFQQEQLVLIGQWGDLTLYRLPSG